MKIQYIEPWRNYNCAYGKGELLIWSFTLEDGIGRVDVGCCWLLLIADGCYWLLDDCWLQLGCWWLLLVASDCWMMLVAAGKLLVGGKVFEYFRDVDDLRLRQFCRQKVFKYFRRGDEKIWLRQVLKMTYNISKKRWRNLAKTSFKIVIEYFEEAMKTIG